MILLDTIAFPQLIIPIILALLGSAGLWTYLSSRRMDPSNIKKNEAQTEEIIANVEAKKAETQLTLYRNAMELVDHLTNQLAAAEKRENILQQRITNIQAAYEQKISELLNSLDFERRERLKIQEEVIGLRSQLEDRRPRGGDQPR